MIMFKLFIKSDQKVSVHQLLYCNHQVHRDFLITLYLTLSHPVGANILGHGLWKYII